MFIVLQQNGWYRTLCLSSMTMLLKYLGCKVQAADGHNWSTRIAEVCWPSPVPMITGQTTEELLCDLQNSH
jgi:hypothetical protein